MSRFLLTMDLAFSSSISFWNDFSARQLLENHADDLGFRRIDYELLVDRIIAERDAATCPCRKLMRLAVDREWGNPVTE